MNKRTRISRRDAWRPWALPAGALGDTFSTGVSSSDIYEHQTPCVPRPLVINGHIMVGKQKSHSAPTERSQPEEGGKSSDFLAVPCGGAREARRRTAAPTHKPSSESRDLRLVTARTKLGLSAPSRTKAPWWSLKGSWGDHLKTSRLKGTFEQNIY